LFTGNKKTSIKEERIMEKGTEKVDTFNKGRCPVCGKEVVRPEEGNISVCDCGERFFFHIAHLLNEEAQFLGTNAAIETLVGQIPKIFSLPHRAAETGNVDFSGHLALQNIELNPPLYDVITAEGAEIVKELIDAKRKEIKQKYGFDIGIADAATIIAYLSIMRAHERDYRYLVLDTVVVQDPVKLKKNEYGEFVLSHCDEKDYLRIPFVEKDGDILVCQPEIEVRYEQVKNNKLTYIKCGLDTFVVAYIREDWPPDSIIYILHKGYVPLG
jgi:hypothetical protein